MLVLVGLLQSNDIIMKIIYVIMKNKNKNMN
ncbi:hypothetical protein BLA29_015394 [Euroglyphus maynei]|uniref:Uncharacterized protein n=1 Tax=Euroglyphus maynei TaxID=6958 RepID=A0A1Y3BNK2_EURMA|nr:hypothetical protein BLA29_015394 [Euroglyphus maynei]